MADLFDSNAARKPETYSAKDIEVLEGLEPVRRRPGMYIGGTDERALHHLAAEILDNAMDEAVAGHASRIEMELAEDGTLTIRDNGRGIPVDPHPKFPDKSALEVILTTLHSGGKFGGDVYKTAGGLHGVGISVVNALSDRMVVEIARDRQLWRQEYSRGLPQGPLLALGPVLNRRGTTITAHPDATVFGPDAAFKPATLYRLARSKAYLFRGVEIRWSCAETLPRPDTVPARDTLHFPGGLGDFLASSLTDLPLIVDKPFVGEADLAGGARVEWAIAWPEDAEGFAHYYCNTIPTHDGGTHELGLRTGLTRAIRAHGERLGNKRAAVVAAEDVVGGTVILLSLFMRDPQFQGQTKDRLVSPEATRLVDATLKDRFEHFLADDPVAAKTLLDSLIEKAEERQRRKQQKELGRKTATRKLRLPGKLADCTRDTQIGTEIFLVEGDSAGGSAKQARNRDTQAILPLRGKILNVASASADKMRANQELSDLILALGCGAGKQYQNDRLRYERVIIMTDADVDGAHIAALLMTFFYREMPELVRNGHLYLALPPLYRLSAGDLKIYARDDAHKETLMATTFSGKGKVEVSRFKGLGEMPPISLRETTMDPKTRVLLRVCTPHTTPLAPLSELDSSDEAVLEGVEQARRTAVLVESLMGRKPELRYNFIQENARFVRDLDI
ncbi:MAG TPA: DNA topoisomerase IV subunit B [Stellaceae bacterium]|nr:DNA topoisomerase IV subunit B [Stellaceae bacterium]